MAHFKRDSVRYVAVATVLLLGAVSARGGIVIDDFSASTAGAIVLTGQAVGVAGSVLETELVGVIGGERLTSLFGFVADPEGLDTVRAAVASAYGVLDYTSSVGGDGDLEIAYAGGFNTDLSGDALIQIDFLGFDLGAGTAMDVTVTLGQGASTASLTHLLTGSGSQNVAFDFLEFDNISAVDLTSIDAIAFRFDPGAGADFRVGGIASIVPEPTTLIMLIAGAGALLRRRRAIA